MAKRFYEGLQVLISGETEKYKINVPDDVSPRGIAVNPAGVVVFKADVDETQHTAILALGNTEIASGNVVERIQTLYPSLYPDYAVSEVIAWRDS